MARVLNVIARPRSAAVKTYRRAIGLTPEAIVPGIAPQPQFDLVDHGGKTIPTLAYLNVYLGGSSYPDSDRKFIDAALASAMTDPGLNGIMSQYFGGQPPVTLAELSQVFDIKLPKPVNHVTIASIVGRLQANGTLAGLDLSQAVVNLLLPPGVILSDTGGAKGHLSLDEEAADSLHGLGGYHGSVHAGGAEIYYAVGVYSQQLAGATENGIVAFDQPWKNVVATFYHELNEVRTDADVEDAVSAGNGQTLLGWTSPQGYEVGDAPVFEAGPNDLKLVFQEVPLTNGGTVPIQLMWSNRVHGPEAPLVPGSTR